MQFSSFFPFSRARRLADRAASHAYAALEVADLLRTNAGPLPPEGYHSKAACP